MVVGINTSMRAVFGKGGDSQLTARRISIQQVMGGLSSSSGRGKEEEVIPIRVEDLSTGQFGT